MPQTGELLPLPRRQESGRGRLRIRQPLEVQQGDFYVLPFQRDRYEFYQFCNHRAHLMKVSTPWRMLSSSPGAALHPAKRMISRMTL